MKPSQIWFSRVWRLTLFTRPQCSLCEDAKKVLSRVWDQRHFEYEEVDVMDGKHVEWKNIYEFDTPVVHVDRASKENDTEFRTTAQARKLLHRFSEQEILEAMDQESTRNNE